MARITAANCILQHEIILEYYYEKKISRTGSVLAAGRYLPVDNIVRARVWPTVDTCYIIIINNRSLNRAFPGPRKHNNIIYVLVYFFYLSVIILYFEPGIGNPDACAYVTIHNYLILVRYNTPCAGELTVQSLAFSFTADVETATASAPWCIII